MGSKLGRALVAAAGLALLAPGAAHASWWDGGYQPARRQPPPEQPPPNQPPPEQPPPEQSPGQTPPPEQPPPQQAPPPCQRPPEQPPCQGPPAEQPPPYRPAPGSGASIYGCENSDLPGTAPYLHKSMTPPAGSVVAPGEEIVVEITWRATDFTAPTLHKVLDCVYVDNRYAPFLSGGERDTPNDGHFGWRYLVPGDAPAGTRVCDQGFLSGPNWREEYAREVSDVLCVTVGGRPAPETTTPPSTTTAPDTKTPSEAQPERIAQQVAPATETQAPPAPPTPESFLELPRTGGDADNGRLAAAALAAALLAGSASRRRTRAHRP